jgi:hypothetical protein
VARFYGLAFCTSSLLALIPAGLIFHARSHL